MVLSGGVFAARKAAELVATANKTPGLIDVNDLEYHGEGFSVKIDHKRTVDVPQDTIKWATELTRNNMQSFYDATWGWNTKSKLKELGHARACHLIAYMDGPAGPAGPAGERMPAAYLHYRWEADPPKDERRKGQPVYAVAYVYELQLAKEAQGNGLGTYLMSLVESEASRFGMHKVMLTCFTSNTAAQRLYQKLGYSKDETSPDPAVDGADCAGYDILSKTLC
eukprot:jgi/Ulvmu1/3656/UM017_0070.1